MCGVLEARILTRDMHWMNASYAHDFDSGEKVELRRLYSCLLVFRRGLLRRGQPLGGLEFVSEHLEGVSEACTPAGKRGRSPVVNPVRVSRPHQAFLTPGPPVAHHLRQLAPLSSASVPSRFHASVDMSRRNPR